MNWLRRLSILCILGLLLPLIVLSGAIDSAAGQPLRWSPFIKISKLSPWEQEDGFGFSVALSGDGSTALIGVPDAEINGNLDQGAAYLFVRSGNSWVPKAKLVAPDGVAQDWFGWSVALNQDGTVALVGAFSADVGESKFLGAAYLFTAASGIWTHRAKLVGSACQPGCSFGEAVALNQRGDMALIGARRQQIGDKENQGMAYVFQRVEEAWEETARLTALDGAIGDFFGMSVALSGDGSVAVVGAPNVKIGENFEQGAAYIFARSGASWAEQQKITALDGVFRYYFGYTVTLSQDGAVALAGGGARPFVYTDPGAVYVFKRKETLWAEQAKISSPSLGPLDNFGSALAVNRDGTSALIAARKSSYDDRLGVFEGAAFIFEAQEGQSPWIERHRFTAPLYGQVSFAFSVALNARGNVALVGNFGEGAYVYEMDLAANVVFLPLVLR